MPPALLDPKLEAASALLESWDHADVDRARWAARLLENVGPSPEGDVLPVVARATRVVLFLRREASSREDAGDRESAGRMCAAAIALEQSARALLTAAEQAR